MGKQLCGAWGGEGGEGACRNLRGRWRGGSRHLPDPIPKGEPQPHLKPLGGFRDSVLTSDQTGPRPSGGHPSGGPDPRPHRGCSPGEGLGCCLWLPPQAGSSTSVISRHGSGELRTALASVFGAQSEPGELKSRWWGLGGPLLGEIWIPPHGASSPAFQLTSSCSL